MQAQQTEETSDAEKERKKESRLTKPLVIVCAMVLVVAAFLLKQTSSH